MKLVVATCQFPVDADIGRNERFIERHLREARRRRADVAHFSECALSGYAGVEFASFARFDWDALEAASRRLMALAAELKLWVVLGSCHRLSGSHRPHNSLYVIDDRGRIRDRYDKLFCTGDASGKRHDLKHYSPGDHFVTFDLKGVRCGLLICHDYRYPELYREYKRRGVELVFHSYHNGHSTRAKLKRSGNIWGVTVPAVMQANAGNNHLWISANNTSRRESCWPSFFVRPDGTVSGRLSLHRTGMLLSHVDPRAKFYDASADWRDRAMRGMFHSGARVRDQRSRARKTL